MILSPKPKICVKVVRACTKLNKAHAYFLMNKTIYKNELFD